MKNVPRLKAGRARFVLLHHQMQASREQESHWDLMFETEHLLLTFRLMLLPKAAAEFDVKSQSIERLPDHRTRYLDYEGPISGDRGRVSRIAGGTFVVVAGFDGEIQVELSSPELTATLEFSLCDVGETTPLKVVKWNLALERL